jgi:hypothetical protein
VSAKTLKTKKDIAVSRAVAAVSETLLQEVTALFKRLLKTRYESLQELDQASEWKELEKLFCESCDAYTSIAINNRNSLRGDLFTWVEEKVKADEDTITVEHFCSHPNGRLALPKNYDVKDDYTWRADSHLGELTAFGFGVFAKNMARAKSTALRNAAIRIASGRASRPQPANHNVSAGGPRSESRALPVHSAVLLSKFESRVGKLMVNARRACPTKHLPKTEILKIAAVLDDEGFPLRDNLEREARRIAAEYNQHHPTVAIKTWKAAISHTKFRRSVRKRFSRAEEKYKRANP